MLSHHRHASLTFRWRGDYGPAYPLINQINKIKIKKKNVVKVVPTITKLSG